MLSNAYLVAKIGADTAENEQHSAEILPKTGNYPTGSCRAVRSCRRRGLPEAPRTRRPRPSPQPATDAGCGKLYRARSRLYRNENLQENMRLKALTEIYTVHSFCTALKSQFFSKARNCQNFAKKIRKFPQNFGIF